MFCPAHKVLKSRCIVAFSGDTQKDTYFPSGYDVVSKEDTLNNTHVVNLDEIDNLASINGFEKTMNAHVMLMYSSF